ncbi:MAG: riboflavin synthase subunit alpha [Acidobacteria bacterium SCN 69-37]|nr:MAG: riboflavin synthase subunit alpha [Acidobacteria bacterium SCN 69-37]
MFTGLIEATGQVEAMSASATGGRLRVQTPFAADLQPGDSVAVNGVCLTAVEVDRDGFAADVAPVTLGVTALGDLVPGRRVNLERAVRADTRIGGHFVLGHIDATGRIVELRQDGEAWRLVVAMPESMAALVIPKGSIAIDGISLTVAAIDGLQVVAQIIPFTFAHTTLAAAAAGDRVNLEFDVLGKYVLRAMDVRGVNAASCLPGL